MLPVLFVLLGGVSAFVALFRMEPMLFGGAVMSALLVAAVYAAQVFVALRGRSWRAVAAQGFLCWAPVIVFRGNWVVLDGFLVAAVLGGVRGVLRWPLSVLVTVAGTALHTRVFSLSWPEAGQELAALWTTLNVAAFAYGVPAWRGWSGGSTRPATSWRAWRWCRSACVPPAGCTRCSARAWPPSPPPSAGPPGGCAPPRGLAGRPPAFP
nr:hypothetical protein GCM10020093_043220 [Planobispora longispora]